MTRRLILFDIDGTLLVGGAAKPAFEHAMVATYGTVGAIDSVSFAGKTDPQIARELLAEHGMPEEQIDQGLPKLFEIYLSELEARLPALPVTRLDGVVELLDALDQLDGVYLGLVTGNVAGGAKLKLGSAGLSDRFSIGGYGSDHEVRNHLPGIAMRRAEAEMGIGFSPEDVVVVGDTPADVECGQFHGTKTVAVATGSYTIDRLRKTGADRVLLDFSDVSITMDAVLES